MQTTTLHKSRLARTSANCLTMMLIANAWKRAPSLD
jgi:hypothetical protein